LETDAVPSAPVPDPPAPGPHAPDSLVPEPPGRGPSAAGRSGRAVFLPSRHGFAFRNSWPSAPAITLPPPFGGVGIGNAADGLCGGMVFAALDYWHAGVVPPAQQPAPGSPLFRYLVHRLITSWSIPAGVAKYYRWMSLPDGDSALDVRGRRLVTRPGVWRRTIGQEWPRVRARLNGEIPTALGVVTVASANPVQLGYNHQILACGYETSGSQVTLHVYDPNSGPRDDVTICFDVAACGSGAFRHNLNTPGPVRGFFQVAYAPAIPPQTPPS
jgi:hypothetical protein